MDLFGETQEDVVYDDDISSDDEDNKTYDLDNRLCEPEKMRFCLGHEAQEALFVDLFKKGTMPHAMTFSGLQGIGKTTMAFRLARFLLKHGKANADENQAGLFGDDSDVLSQDVNSLDVDPSDTVFRLVASGGHPDFLHIRRKHDKTKDRQESVLKVELIREIEPFLRLAASEGGWRVVIVEDADTMNRNAQNAILKILEEPPKNVLIILIAHRPGLLIPTIHSRSRNIQFSPLSSTVMEELISCKEGIGDLSTSDIEALNALSEGSIGQALKYIEQDGLGMFKKTLEYLVIARDGEFHKIHEFSTSIAKPAQETQYRIFAHGFLWILRKLLFLKARACSEVPVYIRNSATQNILTNTSLEKLVSLNDEIKKVFERVDFSNLDRRDAVRSAFLMISH